MAQLLKFLAALAAASALVVRDGSELKAALANGAPAIELAADAYLGGEAALVASPTVIDGKGFTVSQTGRHFLVNGSTLELRDLTLATVDAPSAIPTCAPTTATNNPSRYVEPLVLTDVKDAGLLPCVAPFCTLFKAAAGGGALALSVGGTPEVPQLSTSARAPMRVYLKDGGVVDLPRHAERLFADPTTGAVIAQVNGLLFFVAPDGAITSHPFYRPVEQASYSNLALIELSSSQTAVVESESDRDSGTVMLQLYRASAGEPLEVVSTIDLSDELRDLRRIANFGNAIYATGTLPYKITTEAGRFRPRYVARIDLVDDQFALRWVAEIRVGDGGGLIYPSETELIVPWQYDTNSRQSAQYLFARLDATTGEVLALSEVPRWEPDELNHDQWLETMIEGTSSSFAGHFFSLSSASLGQTLLRRHDARTGAVDWTIDYAVALDLPGKPRYASVNFVTGRLTLVVLVNETTYVASLAGELPPVGDGVPTTSPTRCDHASNAANAVAASGCVTVHDSKFTADGVVFAGCSSDGDGGAIVAVASTVLVNNSTLDGSSALGSGGAVALTGGTLEVAGSSFVGVDAAKSGGAIYAVDAPVVIDACNFTDVTASGDGGAVNVAGALTIRDSTFARCHTELSSGGAVTATSEIMIADTNFISCEADRDGAAIYISTQPIEYVPAAGHEQGSGNLRATIERCEFSRCGAGRNIIRSARNIIQVRGYREFLFRQNVMTANTPRQHLLHMERLSLVKLIDSSFTKNLGARGGGMMRITTLYSGSTLVDGCQFIENTYFEDKGPGECNAFEEGFFFITEAPDQHVLFRNSRFVNNTGTGESFGGALTLRVDASIIGCHFEGNRARQGGAIYVDETSSLSVADSTFVGNVAEVGGAISACGTTKDHSCAGAYDFADVVARDNVALTEDDDKGGGGFAKINGGRPITMRNLMLEGNTAGGAPSSIGLRYSTANLYDVRAAGQIYLSLNGALNTYCSPGLDVAMHADDDLWAIADTPSECSLCPPGLEWTGAPEYACVDCPRGRFKAEGDDACRACRGDRKYQDSEGEQSCKTCPSGKRANKNHTDCRDAMPSWVFPFLLAVAVGFVALLFAFLFYRSLRDAKKRGHLEAERQVLVQEQCTAARERVKEFQAFFSTIRGDLFLALEALRPHEELRSDLVIFDSVADVTAAKHKGDVFVFLSHQWLGYSKPDPNGQHIVAMKQAVRAASEHADVPLERVRVWLDIISIPQRNRPEQRSAINSLPTFASVSQYFIVVAPTVKHCDTGCMCSSRTYRSRAWCRAEIFSCWARNGTTNMYFMDVENGLQSLDVSEEALAEALDVFGGELTCCRLGHPDESPCDKEELMLPVLGLYAEIYARRHGTCAAAYAMISKKKAELFPATFEYVHRSRLETTTSSSTQVLFGDLIAAVEQTIDNEGAGAASRSLEGTFAPGTNAQRHRLLQSRGSKHGSSSSGSTRRLLTKQVSFGANKILKRSSSSLSTASPTPRVTFAETPRADGRPPLLRAKTWRSGPPPM